MRLLLLAFLLLTSPALADVSWVNYLQSNPQINRVKKYDLNGNGMDLGEAGDLKQFGGTFYYYAMSSAQGWLPNVSSPANGFRVYSSPDLVNWTDRGQLLDTTQAPLSTECTGGTVFRGCWVPKMLFNANTGKYVFFYEAYSTGTQAIEVFECATPLPPCTYIGAMPSYTPGSADNTGVFPDEQSSDAYLVYNNGVGGTVFIQKLTSNYHDVTGSATNTGLTGEGVWMKHPATKWMVGAGPTCGECGGGASTSYVSSATALGTYGGLTQLSPTQGCSSQAAEIATIVAGGITTYVYLGAHFDANAVSQGTTTLHMQPLTLTSDLFDAFTCSGSVTIPGVTSTGTYPTPAYPRVFDINFMQSLNSSFSDVCNIGAVDGAIGIMQQFTPTVANMDSVGVLLGRGTQHANVPDGSVEVDVTQDVANVPGTVLGSYTYAAAALPWVNQLFAVPIRPTLTPGTKYDAVIKAVGNTRGCFGYSIATPASPLYGSHLARYTTDGVTWNTIPNAMFQISTFLNTPVPFSGVAH